jgi:hypothetical protein
MKWCVLLGFIALVVFWYVLPDHSHNVASTEITADPATNAPPIPELVTNAPPNPAAQVLTNSPFNTEDRPDPAHPRRHVSMDDIDKGDSGHQ